MRPAFFPPNCYWASHSRDRLAEQKEGKGAPLLCERDVSFAEGGRQEQAVPPKRGAELAVDAPWTLLEQQQLGRKLRAASETLTEAGPASWLRGRVAAASRGRVQRERGNIQYRFLAAK